MSNTGGQTDMDQVASRETDYQRGFGVAGLVIGLFQLCADVVAVLLWLTHSTQALPFSEVFWFGQLLALLAIMFGALGIRYWPGRAALAAGAIHLVLMFVAWVAVVIMLMNWKLTW